MTVFANLTCMVPQWNVPSNVTALTTTRLGGVSKQPFHTLNLGLHVGDEKSAVVENRRRMIQSFAMPGTPVWLNQTHSSTVAKITEKIDAASDTAIEADGSYTCLPHTVLAVLTADCLPVVISDAQGAQAAVVHAGWRGLANGILDNAVKCFKQGSELHAWLGPAIGPSKFEVGDDVRDMFTEYKKINAEHFATGKAPGKYWADIYGLARTALNDAGCHAISGGDYCTHTQSDLFHSYRRDGAASGRIATVVWIS